MVLVWLAVELCQIWKSYDALWQTGNDAAISNLCETCRPAQAQRGTLRRWFWWNHNDTEQEASLTSCPSEIPGLLRDGCLEFCRLMRGTICSTLLADVSPLTLCQYLLMGRSIEGSSMTLWGKIVLFSNRVI